MGQYFQWKPERWHIIGILRLSNYILRFFPRLMSHAWLIPGVWGISLYSHFILKNAIISNLLCFSGMWLTSLTFKMISLYPYWTANLFFLCLWSILHLFCPPRDVHITCNQLHSSFGDWSDKNHKHIKWALHWWPLIGDATLDIILCTSSLTSSWGP